MSARKPKRSSHPARDGVSDCDTEAERCGAFKGQLKGNCWNHAPHTAQTLQASNVVSNALPDKLRRRTLFLEPEHAPLLSPLEMTGIS